MNCKTILAIFLLAITLGTEPARADDTYDQCVAAPAADTTRCGEDWLAREQSALDAKWQSVVAQTDGHVAAQLATEQAAWKAYRDTTCLFMQDPTFAPGGDKSTYFACRAGVIEDRMKMIDAHMSYIDN